MSKSVVKSDLVDRITDEFLVTQDQAAGYISTVISLITEALVRGESVKIGDFGVFSVRDKKERIGRNPKTLEEHIISARRTVSFISAPYLKQAVNYYYD